MEAKEKAKEVVERFMPYAHFWVHDLHPQSAMDEEQLESATQCALICVEEIIKATARETISECGTTVDIIESVYWNKIKTEINKL